MTKNKIIYLAIVFLFVCLTVAIWIYLTRFFRTSIDHTFFIDETKVRDGLNQLHFDKFKAVAPKLGIDTKNIIL